MNNSLQSLTAAELEMCYDAVRYYQMNHIGPFKHGQYDRANSILANLHYVKTPYDRSEAVGTAD